MKTRPEIKLLAKKVFLENYWLTVGVNAVAAALIAAASAFTAGIGSLILAGPITIGLCAFCVQLMRGQPVSFDTLFQEGFTGFGRKLGGYLWMMLFTFLWSLLLFVPGIIKGLSYAMTPYILADCPNVKAQDALKVSMRMMDGHKWEYFVFHLSFLGWMLLSGLTGGILFIFYVGPYMNNALAEYYCDIKRLALEKGIVTAEELA